MEKDGRFWTTDIDAQPRVDIFNVPRSPLLRQGGEYVPGTVSIRVEETPESIEARLKENFPLYRVASWGRKLLGLSGVEDEV